MIRVETPSKLTLHMSGPVDKLAGLSWQYGENILRLRNLPGDPIRIFLMKRRQTTHGKYYLLAIPPYG